jgi:membrane protein DedA with SNARE-associated domain/membrane-associated phospholipid phosphatase
MAEFFQELLAWVAQHPYWAWVLVFLVAMTESLAIVGLLIPGVAIMFGIGALIALDAIPFLPTMLWAAAGAVTGDGLSFWLGRRYQQELRGMWPFSRYPSTLDQGIAFFERFGGKSVAIGRFFGPVRAVVPLVAGMMGMTPARFLFANILSALAWAPAYLLPGMAFGASLELAAEVAWRLVALLLLLAGVIWLAAWLVHRLFDLLHPHASALVEGMLRWSGGHPLLGQIANALADPRHPEAKGLSLLATLLTLAMGLFALLLGAVLQGGALAGVDHWITLGLQSLRGPWADHLMLHLARLGDGGVLTLLALVLAALCAWRGNLHTAFYWLAALAFCLLVPFLLKLGLQVPRPELVAMPPDSYAFPSGHALRATVIFGLLAVLLARPLSERWRWLPYSLATLPILGVGLSRVYLGVHWPSDVLGGIALGLVWVAALGLAIHRHTFLDVRWRGLALVALVTLGVGWGWATAAHHAEEVASHAPRVTLRSLPAEQWRQQGGRELPTTLADLRRSNRRSLDIQYAGSLERLATALQEAGWRPAPTLGWDKLLRLLSPTLPLHELPVLPQVHGGHHEALRLERPLADGRRLVLRLWDAQVELTPEGRPLWIGYAAPQHRAVIAGMLAYAATDDNDRATLAKELATIPGGRLRDDDAGLRFEFP